MLAVLVLLTTTAAGAPDERFRSTPDDTRLLAYTVLVASDQADRLRQDHFDISSIRGTVGRKLKLEIIMTEADAQKLIAQGLDVTLNPGQTTDDQ